MPSVEKTHNRLLIEIVSENQEAVKVFYKFGIDYCCNGKKTLVQSVAELNVDLEEVCNELSNLGKSGNQTSGVNVFMPDELINYIIDEHHGYLHLNLPLIHEYGQIVLLEEQNKPYRADEIVRLFAELRDNLSRYLFKEEQIIFPYILNITEAYKSNLKIEIPPFRKIMNSLNFMELENNETHALLNQIKDLTNNYSQPENTSKTFKLFFSKLKELEENIYQHMHLKNNILFPKSIELENCVNSLNN